ncbi:unnamed protein product [Phaedon cochleariae]|uniref:HECT domain-containing protein n=1 Tax=Phaedon cochleariae TaxID=80249 RepID=A0A9P0GW90_PHACE|nr:unnamed protein product [Phaedon cochleariae]
MVSFGWIRNGVQVRSKSGGGSRRLSVPVTWKKADLLEKAIQLFFAENPNDKELETCTILDFKHHEFDDDLTVEKIFDVTKLTYFSFYLSTTTVPEKDKPETNNNEETASDTPTQTSDTLPSIPQVPPNDSEPFVMEDFVQLFTVNDGVNLELPITEEFIIESSQNLEQIKLILHRGHIMNELLEAFKSYSHINIVLEIEMLLPNGQKEAAFDGGGVYRDALCEFWSEFYQRLCTGNTCKIPEIRHDYDESSWLAVARILLQGYKQAKYFPSKLSRAFMEQVLFGTVVSDITESFFNYLGPYDSGVLKKTLDNPEEADISEIIDIMDNLGCKSLINKENVSKVIRDIAHAELIQKSMFIIDAWKTVLRNKITFEDIVDVYETKKINNKNVLE